MPEDNNGDDSYTACVNAKIEGGMSREEAEAACKAAEKSTPPAIQSTEQFEQYINEAVQKALEGYKDQLIQRSVEAVQEVKRALQDQTINAVKKAITPEQKSPLYREDLAEAIRQIQLENLKKDERSSELDTNIQPNDEGYGEPQPKNIGEIRKRVDTDLKKFTEQFQNPFAPKTR